MAPPGTAGLGEIHILGSVIDVAMMPAHMATVNKEIPSCS
jgi:hypothetical protein